ncbi:MAG: high frequency lysogenization protein HflD [Candidatus Competibacteraceae bacterium]|nr:high frequency lysogenization protein HflD [Candidatus Competibacteraceae bacterium]
MQKNDRNRIIALAGLFQATAQVGSIAHTGQVEVRDFETCILSLFKIDAQSAEDVYGGLEPLRSGLKLVVEQLRHPQSLEATRYAISLLVLERKLNSNPRLLGQIRQGILDSQERLQHFPATHDNIIAQLADLYTQTVSTLRPRIMVNGEHTHLSRPENAARIRALLLAGIRAAVLWRQSGGGRLTLLLRRRALLLEAQRLLADLEG